MMPCRKRKRPKPYRYKINRTVIVELPFKIKCDSDARFREIVEELDKDIHAIFRSDVEGSGTRGPFQLTRGKQRVKKEREGLMAKTQKAKHPLTKAEQKLAAKQGWALFTRHGLNYDGESFYVEKIDEAGILTRDTQADPLARKMGLIVRSADGKVLGRRK